jgi:hypothetical protein
VPSVRCDAGATPLKPLTREFLSFNIDTASLYHNLNLTSFRLRNAVKQLAPAFLRVGGSAADTAYYTGAEGARGGADGHTLVRVNSSLPLRTLFVSLRVLVDVLIGPL